MTDHSWEFEFQLRRVDSMPQDRLYRGKVGATGQGLRGLGDGASFVLTGEIHGATEAAALAAALRELIAELNQNSVSEAGQPIDLSIGDQRLLGISELADTLGVTKQRASAISRSDSFPSPYAQLAAGPVWLDSSIKGFINGWDRKPGRPRQLDIQPDEDSGQGSFRRRSGPYQSHDALRATASKRSKGGAR